MRGNVQITGLSELQAWARERAPDQVQWTTALSITHIAQRSQTQVQLEQETAFILRRPDFIHKGVRIKAATKYNLVAHVLDIHDFMALQERGGTKLPMHGQYVCVPLRGARPNPTALIAPDNMPENIMRRGGFIRGNIMYATYKRVGRYPRGEGPTNAKRVGGGRGGGILPMYVLVHSAVIKARYGMYETVADTVHRFFAIEFHKAFEASVGTRKPTR